MSPFPTRWLAGLLLLGGCWLADFGRAAAPDFSSALRVLETAVDERAFPGCSIAVGTANELLWLRGVGYLDYDRKTAVTPTTVYDLASLTKVVGTTTVVMQLVREGKLKLDDRVVQHLPEFAQATEDEQRMWRGAVTIEHLLTHSSGLPAAPHTPKDARSYTDVLAGALATPLARIPGERTVYSDAGYIVLGEAAARAGGQSLAALERKYLIEPLKLARTARNPPPEWLANIAPTEKRAGSESFWRGMVHDENARAGEGLTGHAGLFSTAEDLGRFAGEMLRAAKGDGRCYSTELARRFIARRGLVAGSTRALGWDTPSDKNSSAGDRLSRRSFGHTGFTGTSLWIDPDRGLYVVLLSNRVHPTRANQKIHAVRRHLHDAVAEAFDAQ